MCTHISPDVLLLAQHDVVRGELRVEGLDELLDERLVRLLAAHPGAAPSAHTHTHVSCRDAPFFEHALEHGDGRGGVEVAQLDGRALLELGLRLEARGDERRALRGVLCRDVARDGAALEEDEAVVVLRAGVSSARGERGGRTM